MMNAYAKSLALLAGVAASFVVIQAATAAGNGAVTIQLPPETAQLKPGPGIAVARANCIACHSVDYIYMQPPLTREQWHGEVVKMKKVMGAPIADSDIDTIVDYLMSQNGKK
jgi:mono/diheme cytochrome c family protein